MASGGLYSSISIISSSIDHIYVSIDLENRITSSKINHSSSDHLPIIADIKLKGEKNSRRKTITKRSTKNFTKQLWCNTLKDLRNESEMSDTSDSLEEISQKIEALIM